MVFIEGLILCIILFLYYAIGIRKGAINLICLYEENVQNRAIKIGLTTPEKIKQSTFYFLLMGFIMYLAYPLICVYVINGTRGFFDCFFQTSTILLIMGVFNRIVIDIIWIGHTKAWIIPGTEDLRPYIPRKVHLMNWVVTILVLPAFMSIISWIMTFLLK